VIHARRTASPVLDFRAAAAADDARQHHRRLSVRLGMRRVAVSAALFDASDFGLSPLRSGLVTFASAVGAMGMKTLAALIVRTFGFRNIMIINAVVSSIFWPPARFHQVATARCC